MSNKNTSSGLGISGVLFIVFLVLKLTKIIDWSWLWVFAPLWIPWGLVFIVFIIAIIMGILREK